MDSAQRFYGVSLLLALLVHALVAAMLWFNWTPTQRDSLVIRPNIVKAELLVMENPKPKTQPKAQQPPPPPPAEKPRPEPKPEPKPVPKPEPKPDLTEDAILDILGPSSVLSERSVTDTIHDFGDSVIMRESGIHHTPRKPCVKCNRDIPATIHICPYCHTYLPELIDARTQ